MKFTVTVLIAALLHGFTHEAVSHAVGGPIGAHTHVTTHDHGHSHGHSHDRSRHDEHSADDAPISPGEARSGTIRHSDHHHHYFEHGHAEMRGVRPQTVSPPPMAAVASNLCDPVDARRPAVMPHCGHVSGNASHLPIYLLHQTLLI